MIEVRSPLPDDIKTIGKDAAEEWVRGYAQSGADFTPLISDPYSRVMLINGQPVAAGGFIDRGNALAIAWSIVGVVEPNMFTSLCRTFRRGMEATPYKWIEAHCMCAFTQSHRWVRCLGFEPVNGERCFAPDGREFRKFVFWNGYHGT